MPTASAGRTPVRKSADRACDRPGAGSGQGQAQAARPTLARPCRAQPCPFPTSYPIMSARISCGLNTGGGGNCVAREGVSGRRGVGGGNGVVPGGGLSGREVGTSSTSSGTASLSAIILSFNAHTPGVSVSWQNCTRCAQARGVEHLPLSDRSISDMLRRSYLYAYGDSRGDRELMKCADFPSYRCF